MTTVHSTAAPTYPSTPTPRRFVSCRRLGLAVALTTLAWGSATMTLAGRDGFGGYSMLGGATAFAFQLSLMGLVVLEYRTHAVGTGRFARLCLRLQCAVLAGAMVSTVLDAFWLIHGTPVWAVFDACWPLSMLGMAAIGIRIAIAGRWTGALRWQTPFAQSWVLWAIPFMAFPVTGLVQLAAGYGVLGAMLLRTGRLPISA